MKAGKLSKLENMIANDSVTVENDYHSNDMAKRTRYGALMFVLMKLKVLKKDVALHCALDYTNRRLSLQNKRNHYKWIKFNRSAESQKQMHDLPPRNIKPTKVRL